MGISSVLQFSVSLLAATAVNATPLLKSRGVISHNAVAGFPETVPGGTTGDVYEAYQPFLKVVNGCVPFPAVDAAGNTRYVPPKPTPSLSLIKPVQYLTTCHSGGLAPTGGSNSNCGSNIGQIYVRGGTLNGRTGLMYSWYVQSIPLPPPCAALPQNHLHR